ncbi:hypothetical protein IFM89_025808 [Coptis chinensis]|uniref:Uncharacterized protein n=1 Tax=Coptis chinensis TaxID=261450 RepID=A0A835HFI1_9MAGN|nr:hypothetical protein IFM89_025808 [Coptis chinensis]
MSNFLQQSGGYALIDGGLAGADLNDPLWSAKCLISSPHLIQTVMYTSITLKQVRILFSRHLIRLLFRGLNLKACQKKIVKHCCREVLKLHVRHEIHTMRDVRAFVRWNKNGKILKA